MTLSYSRDPFTCFTTRQDLATFWDATAGRSPISAGCPAPSSTTAPRPWSGDTWARGEAVPLHPEAVAFAEHYGFVIEVLAPYRPPAKAGSSAR